MTVHELIQALSEFDNDIELPEIKVPLSIYKLPRCNYIASAYFGNKRIAGGHVCGNLVLMEYKTSLDAAAGAILTGLKLRKFHD